MTIKCNALTNQTKSSRKNVISGTQGSILLAILRNPYFTRFLLQIMAVLFPPGVLIELRNKFVSPNKNSE